MADDEATIQSAVWKRDRIEAGNKNGIDGAMRVFFGHTTVDGGPKTLGNCFFIDTGAVYKLMDENHKLDLYLTLIEIKAAAADICNPAPTQEKLVRTATAKPDEPKNGGPKI
jgi:hypothetical protein